MTCGLLMLLVGYTDRWSISIGLEKTVAEMAADCLGTMESYYCLLYNICNCAITFSIVLTSNKVYYPEALNQFLTTCFML